jgi:outer membrane beta-barrel protein
MTRPAALLVALVALVLPAAGAAASGADAFGGRIPPVSGQLYTKAGKLELTPTASLSLNDAFFSKTFFGLSVGYHFSEALSVSGSFAAGFSSATGSTVVCPGNQGCHTASAAQLDQVAGDLKTIVGAQLAFSPVYGKLNAFAEHVIHFDLSLLGGGDLIRHRGVLSAADANAGSSPGVRSTLGGHLGLGARVFFTRSLALRLEVKDYLYTVPVLGSTTVQNQLFTELGLSWFLDVVHKEHP